MSRIQINLRVEEELLQPLKEAAQKDKRSTNNLIEKIIEEYLLQNGYIDNQ